MTKRCLFTRCLTCGGLMYIDEAEVVTCRCPEFSDAAGGGWNIPDLERSVEMVRRNGVDEVEVSRYVIKDDEAKR